MTIRISDEQFIAIAIQEDQGKLTQEQAARKAGYTRQGYKNRKDRLEQRIEETLQRFTKVNENLTPTLESLISRARDIMNDLDDMRNGLKNGKPPKGLNLDKHDLLDVINSLGRHVTNLIVALNKAETYIDARKQEIHIHGEDLWKRIERYREQLEG